MGEHEIEAVLVILAPVPSALIDRLERLEHLAGCRLRAQPVQRLRDCYFDRAGEPLQARGYALRIRRAGPSWLLCLKGRSHRNGLSTHRLEIEGPPGDRDLLERIEGELLRRGLLAAGHPEGHSPGSAAPGCLSRHADALAAAPRAALERAGWRPIQDRDTLRRPWDLVAPDGSHPARLAIDTVAYEAAGRTFRHHELEIESAAPEAVKTVEGAAHELLAAFAPELQPWLHSKLATGLAVTALAARDRPEGLADASGEITARGHALIDKYLRRRRGAGSPPDPP